MTTFTPAAAYELLYTGALIVIGLLMLLCLLRAIRGPRVADRIIAINMMGTLVIIMVCILAFLMDEGYLTDIAIIYTMLSFLAVVLLAKVCIGVARARLSRLDADPKDDEKEALK